MTFYPYICKCKQQGNSPTTNKIEHLRVMLQITFPKIESDIYSLNNYDVKKMGDIVFIGTHLKQVNLSFNDIVSVLGEPNYQLGFSYRWYLQVDDDIILITLIEITNSSNKLEIATNNTKNEDLELIFNYFLFLSKGYKKLLEKKTNSELLELVDIYFNTDVWYDFVFETDSETKISFKKVLREFLINKLLDEVSLQELINDGYIKLDY